MKVGLLFSFRNPPAWRRPWPEVYRAALADIEHAERLGFDSIWLTEHHFAEDGYSPSLLTIAAAVATRTERLRIGTNVLLLPLHHPIRVAEDAATVDVLSNGRLDLGVGQGYAPGEFAGYGISRSERASRLEEGLEVISGAWTQASYSHSGQHWQLDGVAIEPRPVQTPHPPLWVGGRGKKALDRAARLGCHFLGIGDPAAARTYGERLIAHGRDPAKFESAQLAFGHVAATRERAWSEAEAHFHWLLSCYGRWLGDARDFAGDEALAAVPTARELRTAKTLLFSPMIGSPDDVSAALESFLASVHTTQLIVCLHLPGLDPARTRTSMELFAREVRPRLTAKSEASREPP